MKKISVDQKTVTSASIRSVTYSEVTTDPEDASNTQRLDRHRTTYVTSSMPCSQLALPMTGGQTESTIPFPPLQQIRSRVKCNYANDSILTTNSVPYTQKDFIRALNDVRKDPSVILNIMKAQRERVQGKTMFLPQQNVLHLLKEGLNVYDEAIQYIEEMVANKTSLSRLGPEEEEGLHYAAQELCDDNGTRGCRGQRGVYDGSTVQDRILRYGGVSPSSSCFHAHQIISYTALGTTSPYEVIVNWLIDDGVKTRINRKTLMQDGLACVGIHIGHHISYGLMVCLILSAQGYHSNPSSVIQETYTARKALLDQASTSDHTCRACRKGISEEGLGGIYGFYGRRFHVHCFTCSVCASTMRSHYCVVGDHPDSIRHVCPPCAGFRLAEMCSKCNKQQVQGGHYCYVRGHLEESQRLCSACAPPLSPAEQM